MPEKKQPKAEARKDPTQYVDATNLIVGRLAAHVANDLLQGKKIVIVNAEKAVFTGNPVLLAKRWQTRLDLAPKGNPEYGPRFSKMPDRIVREIIEGMVPHKTQRGIDAMKRLRVYIGTPAQYAKNEFGTITKAQNAKSKGATTVLALAEAIGYTGLKG